MTRSLISFFCFVLLITSCAQNKKNDYVVTIKTEYGDMIAILYDETPLHKANFIKLAKEHYFDSLLFHRVIQGFMIQSGDSASRHATPTDPLGLHGKKYTIPAEFNPKFFHEKGALSAARQSDQVNPTKASSGSQFYIVQGTVFTQGDVDAMKVDMNKLMTGLRKMFEDPKNKPLLDSLNALYYSGDVPAYQRRLTELVPRVEKATGTKVSKEISAEKVKAYTTIGGAPHLDGDYTVFGKIIKGLDVIDKIAAVETVGKGVQDRPMKDVRLLVTVEEMSKKKITKEYGVVYPEKK